MDMVRLDFLGQNRPLALNADRGDGKTQSLGYFTFKYPFAVLRTPYHMVCRLVNAISVVYYFHYILNFRKLFKTPISERWGKQICLNE